MATPETYLTPPCTKWADPAPNARPISAPDAILDYVPFPAKTASIPWTVPWSQWWISTTMSNPWPRPPLPAPFLYPMKWKCFRVTPSIDPKLSPKFSARVPKFSPILPKINCCRPRAFFSMPAPRASLPAPGPCLKEFLDFWVKKLFFKKTGFFSSKLRTKIFKKKIKVMKRNENFLVSLGSVCKIQACVKINGSHTFIGILYYYSHMRRKKMRLWTRWQRKNAKHCLIFQFSHCLKITFKSLNFYAKNQIDAILVILGARKFKSQENV